MKLLSTPHLLATLCAASWLLLGATPAAAAGYTMSQTGFSGGGVLSGAFSGSDSDADGRLTLGELVDFNLVFSGDSLVGDLTLSLADLGGFTYELGGPWLGDDPNEGVSDLALTFLSGQAAVGTVTTFVDGGGLYSEATGAIAVSARDTPTVALPPAWALLPLALAALGAARLQRSGATGGDPEPKQSLKVNSSET